VEKDIAKIAQADIMYEDHGILTFYIQFDGGGWGQAFPMYNINHGHGMELVNRVLSAVGVNAVHELVGKTVFVLRDEPYGEITGIENLPTECGEQFLIEDWKVTIEATA
jgi:hypothetical protein